MEFGAVAGIEEQSMSELLDLSGKSAVVTGGAMGLGYAISRRLGRAGAQVLISDKNLKAVENSARRLTEDGCEIIAMQADVSEEGDIGRIFQYFNNKRVTYLNDTVFNALAMGDIAVSIAFASPTVFAWSVGKPGIYFDPNGVYKGAPIEKIEHVYAETAEKLCELISFWCEKQENENMRQQIWNEWNGKQMPLSMGLKTFQKLLLK